MAVVRSARGRQEPPAPLPPMETGELPWPAPGMVFHPTDEDLVVYYLRRYVSDQPLPEGLVVPADVYGTEPWNLLGGREEAFFFCRRTRRSPNSKWPSRSAGGGSWQAFKREEEIKSAVDGCGEVTVGIKNSLAYRHSEQKYSGWVMYEFELFDREIFQELVLCRMKETRKGKNKQGKQPAATSSDQYFIDGDEGDVAVTSCSTMPPPPKKRRINWAPDDPTLVSYPSRTSKSSGADGIEVSKPAEHGGRAAPCSSHSSVTATMPPLPQEQPDQRILASRCVPVVDAPPSLFETLVGQQGDFIDCVSFLQLLQREISLDDHVYLRADAFGIEVPSPPRQVRRVADHVGVHGEQVQLSVPIASNSGTIEERTRHPIPITEPNWMQQQQRGAEQKEAESETIVQWASSLPVGDECSTALEITAAEAGSGSIEQVPPLLRSDEVKEELSWTEFMNSQSLDILFYDDVVGEPDGEFFDSIDFGSHF